MRKAKYDADEGEFLFHILMILKRSCATCCANQSGNIFNSE